MKGSIILTVLAVLTSCEALLVGVPMIGAPRMGSVSPRMLFGGAKGDGEGGGGAGLHRGEASLRVQVLGDRRQAREAHGHPYDHER